MKHLVIIGLIILIIPTVIKAQLFVDIQLIPNTTIIKGKYFNGSGGRGYWSLEYLDTNGRVIINKNYRKKKLLSVQKMNMIVITIYYLKL